MTNFEYMKAEVLKTVQSLDEEELMQLCSDTCMDEHLKGVWNCGICEETYGDCPGGFSKGCTNKYLKWCGVKYQPESGVENKAEIVAKLSELLKVTRIGSGIKDLDLSRDRNKVTIHFAQGSRDVNVECDSGYAMILDILSALQ